MSTQTFDAEYLCSWCGPCHALGPVLEKLTNEPNKSASGLPFDLVKIDTDSEDGQVLGGTYKVRLFATEILPSIERTKMYTDPRITHRDGVPRWRSDIPVCWGFARTLCPRLPEQAGVDSRYARRYVKNT